MSRSHTVDFSRVRSAADLAVVIGCAEELIASTIRLNDMGGPPEPDPVEHLIYQLPEHPSNPPYSSLDLRKKNARHPGERRRVWVIHRQDLAAAQKALLRRLNDYLVGAVAGFPGESVHGYVSDRSILTNARVHVGAPWLLNADIRDFFGSITTARVAASLKEAGLTIIGAHLLARFTTVGGSLPLGFNTSPLLANLVCINLDNRMMALASNHGCRYTRYADDLTFSCDQKLPTRTEVESALAAEGFRLAEGKFRTSRRGQCHFVTGLSVSDFDKKVPRLPKQFKRRLRQELYYCEKFGVEEHFSEIDGALESGMNRLDGRIAFARGIEPQFADRLWRRWKAVLRSANRVVVYPSHFDRAPHGVTIVFDESGIDSAFGPVFSLCCAVIDDADGVRRRIEDLQHRVLADPFVARREGKLESRGFHFSDDSEEVRTDFIRLLASLPVRAFVVYGQPSSSFPYEKLYADCFHWLLRDRFYGTDRRTVEIVCEENPQVKKAVLEGAVATMYRTLECIGSRRPLRRPSVRCLGKLAEPLLCLPDYLLGVFGAYALSQARADKRELAVSRFERLRDHFRLVVSLNSRVRYNRRFPFTPWPPGSTI